MDDLHRGDIVPVTFLPNDPSCSVLSDPVSDEHQDITDLVVILIIISGAWFIGTRKSLPKISLTPPFRTRGGR